MSERRELKECLLISPALASGIRRATLLPEGHTIAAMPGAKVAVRAPGRYVLDPDPAVTRAGVVEELARSLADCWKIDDQIAFLSSDTLLRTPFARTLEVMASLPWNLKELRRELRALNVGTVDIRKRGSAVDVDELERQLKLEGTVAATVILTRVADAPWMLICREPAEQ